jgi:hypothetical protein
MTPSHQKTSMPTGLTPLRKISDSEGRKLRAKDRSGGKSRGYEHNDGVTSRSLTLSVRPVQCPFSDLSETDPDVCGVFFSALIQSVCGNVPVEHTQAGTTLACCAFLVTLSPHTSRP